MLSAAHGEFDDTASNAATLNDDAKDAA